MKTKLSVLLLLTLAVIGGVIKLTWPQVEARENQAVASNGTQSQNAQDLQQAQPKEVPGTIDGSKNPESIPDHVAYSMLFKLIAGRTTPEAKKNIRAYISQLGIGVQRCKQCPTSTENGDADIDALIAAAEEYQQRIGTLDEKATKIKGRSWPNPDPDVLRQLDQLQGQNEAVSREFMTQLPSRLSPTAWARLQQQIKQRVKPGIKIVPGPGPDMAGMDHDKSGMNHDKPGMKH